MIVRSKNKALIQWVLANFDEKYDYISIANGGFDFWLVFYRLMGKKCVRVWIGTDVYKCKFWDYRIRAKILSLFSDNVTVVVWLTEELKEYKIKAITKKHDECVGVLSHWLSYTSKLRVAVRNRYNRKVGKTSS